MCYFRFDKGLSYCVLAIDAFLAIVLPICYLSTFLSLSTFLFSYVFIFLSVGAFLTIDRFLSVGLCHCFGL